MDRDDLIEEIYYIATKADNDNDKDYSKYQIALDLENLIKRI